MCYAHGRCVHDPVFCNLNGQPAYVTELPTGAREVSAEPPAQRPCGHPYTARVVEQRCMLPHGIASRLEIAGAPIIYEPLWVTPENAAAFGMVLLRPGEALRLPASPAPLSHRLYKYGVFAGHWSPYLGQGKRLLSVVGTDLEQHAFPHVFASLDTYHPLVISVGRLCTTTGALHLADLWVPRGCALYAPPQPLDADGARPCLYLHGNRNSARACWGDLQHDHVHTETLLDVEGFIHWYWSSQPSEHPLLAEHC